MITDDFIEDYLEHHGVKGMRWRQHKAKKPVEASSKHHNSSQHGKSVVDKILSRLGHIKNPFKTTTKVTTGNKAIESHYGVKGKSLKDIKSKTSKKGGTSVLDQYRALAKDQGNYYINGKQQPRK